MAKKRRTESQSPSAEYAEFVPHPRYGRSPRFTGLVPEPVEVGEGMSMVKLHWHSPQAARVDGTAVKADISRQTITSLGVTHYFDVRRACRDCGQPFLFFAEEQKHWYEELGFSIEANAVRCVPCRKSRQSEQKARERYEALVHRSDRNDDEAREMVECILTLVESGVFGHASLTRARALAKRLNPKVQTALLKKLSALEERCAAN